MFYIAGLGNTYMHEAKISNHVILAVANFLPSVLFALYCLNELKFWFLLLIVQNCPLLFRILTCGRIDVSDFIYKHLDDDRKEEGRAAEAHKLNDSRLETEMERLDTHQARRSTTRLYT